MSDTEGVEVRPCVDLFSDLANGINAVECFLMGLVGASQKPEAFHIDLPADPWAVDERDVEHGGKYSA